MDVYAAREDPVPGVTGALVAAAVPLPPAQVVFEPSWSAVAGHLADRARPGDVVLTCGAGDVTMIGPEVLARLEARRDGVVSTSTDATSGGAAVAARGRAPPAARLRGDRHGGRAAGARLVLAPAWLLLGIERARRRDGRRSRAPSALGPAEVRRRGGHPAGHPAGPPRHRRGRGRGWPSCRRCAASRCTRHWPRTVDDRGARAGAGRRAQARRGLALLVDRTGVAFAPGRPPAARRCRWSARRSTAGAPALRAALDVLEAAAGRRARPGAPGARGQPPRRSRCG